MAKEAKDILEHMRKKCMVSRNVPEKMSPYQEEFARFYDIIVHGQKEVEASKKEVEFVEQAFLSRYPGEVNRILDVGCGNGRFLISLARKGYEVTGLDINKHMLEECSRRLEKQNLKADLILMDLETMDFAHEYDALICMDSVICYFLEPEKIIKMLERFRHALRSKGILIVENWNMLAQWKLLGKTQFHKYMDEEMTIQWQERYTYETFTSIFRIEIRGNVLEEGVSSEFSHEEILRAMTRGEMHMYLKEAGFTQCSVYPSFDPAEVANKNGDVMIFLAIAP